jgi:glc operon protein GlcG
VHKMLVPALYAALIVAVPSGAQQTAASAPAANPLDAVPDKMPFDVPYGAPVSLARATAVINAAVEEAHKHDWKLNVAVVDSGGNLVAFQRMDGAQLASIQISEHKARAAVTFRRETKAWESAIQTNGAHYVMTLDGMIGSRGGIPLIDGGRIIGAIGCSGGTGSQDEVACKAGVAALQK